MIGIEHDDVVEQPRQIADDSEPIDIRRNSVEPTHSNQLDVCLDIQQEENSMSRIVPQAATPLSLPTEESRSYEPMDQVVQTRPYPVFEGTFSNILIGEWNGHKVAIKVVRGVGAPYATRRRLNREKRVWGSLVHRNILPLFGYCEGFGEYGALISPLSRIDIKPFLKVPDIRLVVCEW